MPVRQKAFIAFVLCLANFFGSIILLDWLAPRFLWLAVVLPVTTGLYLLSLRCGKCHTPIFKRQTKSNGMTFTYWGGFTIPRKCSQCGNELS